MCILTHSRARLKSAVFYTHTHYCDQHIFEVDGEYFKDGDIRYSMIYDIIVYIASIFFCVAIIRELLDSLNRVSSIKQKGGKASKTKKALKRLKLIKTPLSFASMTSMVIGILLIFEISLNFKKWTKANELLMSGVYINVCRMKGAAKAAGMNWEHITPFSLLWKSTPETEEFFDWTMTLQIDKQIYRTKVYRGWLLNFYGPFTLFFVFCCTKVMMTLMTVVLLPNDPLPVLFIVDQDVYKLWEKQLFGVNGRGEVCACHSWNEFVFKARSASRWASHGRC